MVTTNNIIDGKKISTDIKEEIASKVAERKAQNKKLPHLAIILVGDDGASQTYVDNKVKAWEKQYNNNEESYYEEDDE